MVSRQLVVDRQKRIGTDCPLENSQERAVFKAPTTDILLVGDSPRARHDVIGGRD
jgi:hypothetical protein